MDASPSPSPFPDTPDAQLHLEVRSCVVRSLATRRPILHRLNSDTSWLLQIPRPASAVKYGARIYYNILIDPWFVGGQSDRAGWFSQQWHKEESAVKSVKEVEELCRQIEVLAGGLRSGGMDGRGSLRGSIRGSLRRKLTEIEIAEAMLQSESETVIDVVAISHEFTDHCHRETLLEIHPDVPILATEVCSAAFSTAIHPTANTSPSKPRT